MGGSMVIDKFKHLRTSLFGNTEPSVTLEFITTSPVMETQNIPVCSAAVSYGSINRLDSQESMDSLTRSLKKKKHLTPFESVTYGLHIQGISKACGAQLSRYRMSGHISASRRYITQKELFVYPILEKINDEGLARECYSFFEHQVKMASMTYSKLRDIGISKQDSRLVVPVCSSTERIMWVNARSLFHIFDERLQPDAEAEIRRLCHLILNVVRSETPLLFEEYGNE
jgi:thymidylate synthase (FAD)